MQMQDGLACCSFLVLEDHNFLVLITNLQHGFHFGISFKSLICGCCWGPGSWAMSQALVNEYPSVRFKSHRTSCNSVHRVCATLYILGSCEPCKSWLIYNAALFSISL